MNKYHIYEKAVDTRGNEIPGLYITTLYAYKDVLNLVSYLQEKDIVAYWETHEQTKGEKNAWKKKK